MNKLTIIAAFLLNLAVYATTAPPPANHTLLDALLASKSNHSYKCPSLRTLLLDSVQFPFLKECDASMDPKSNDEMLCTIFFNNFLKLCNLSSQLEVKSLINESTIRASTDINTVCNNLKSIEPINSSLYKPVFDRINKYLENNCHGICIHFLSNNVSNNCAISGLMNNAIKQITSNLNNVKGENDNVKPKENKLGSQSEVNENKDAVHGNNENVQKDEVNSKNNQPHIQPKSQNVHKSAENQSQKKLQKPSVVSKSQHNNQNNPENNVVGNNHEDTVVGNNREDTVVGNNREDTIVGNNPENTVVGNNPEETVVGNNPEDTVAENTNRNHPKNTVDASNVANEAKPDINPPKEDNAEKKESPDSKKAQENINTKINLPHQDKEDEIHIENDDTKNDNVGKNDNVDKNGNVDKNNNKDVVNIENVHNKEDVIKKPQEKDNLEDNSEEIEGMNEDDQIEGDLQLVDSEGLKKSEKKLSKPKEVNEDVINPINSEQIEEEDSFFFVYFMMVCAVFILGYIGYHNKQKVLALVIEGRRGRRNSRRGGRPNSANYHKLDSNLEEAVTSSVHKNTTNIIY